MYCRKCGKNIKSSEQFCRACGAENELGNRGIYLSKRTLIPSILVIALIIIIIVIAVVLWGRREDGSSGSGRTDPIVVSEGIGATEEEVLQTEGTDYNGSYEDAIVKLSHVIVSADVLEQNTTRPLSELTKQQQSSVNYELLDAVADGRISGGTSYNQIENPNRQFTEESAALIVNGLYGRNPEESVSYADEHFNQESGLITLKEIIKEENVFFTNYELVNVNGEAGYYNFSAPCYRGTSIGNVREYVYTITIQYEHTVESAWGICPISITTSYDPVEISYAKATSTLPETLKKSYMAQNVLDGKLETAWVENAQGVGIGEEVTLYLATKKSVHTILIYNGYMSSLELYNKNGKITTVQIDFGEGTVIKADLTVHTYTSKEEFAKAGACTIHLDKPVYTDTITVTILDAEGGTDYNDTCISEIKIY